MTSGIRARLAGTHVLLTGVTGFVGEALLQRLLALTAWQNKRIGERLAVDL